MKRSTSIETLRAQFSKAVNEYGEKVFAAIYDRGNAQKVADMKAARARVEIIKQKIEATGGAK